MPAAGAAGAQGDARRRAREVLRVLATDPAAVRDFQAFCEATGHELVEHSEQAGEFTFLLRKEG